MRIAIGSDHAAYQLKNRIAETLRDEGHEVTDLGTSGPEPVDYPDCAVAVGNWVRNGDADKGILLCGSGIGTVIAANKLRGIRAALCHDCYSAHQSVEHNNANILCLGARIIGEQLALEIVHIWLDAKFSGEERFRRRLAKIEAIEEKECTT